MKVYLVSALALAVCSPSLLAQSTAETPPESPTTAPEITVTAPERQRAASTATKTDIPILEIPQSIQVVDETLLQDRGLNRIGDVIETVSGVRAEAAYGPNTTFFNIRGFSTSFSLRDGFVAHGYHETRDIQAVERVEVLKGPSSVLYGASNSLGGYINTVSKRPLAEPQLRLALQTGSDSLLRPTVDANAPLTADKRLLGRINLAYEHNESFRDTIEYDSASIAPALSYQLGENTLATLLYEYNRTDGEGYEFGLPNLALTPRIRRERYFGLPEDDNRGHTHAGVLLLDHTFASGWKYHGGINVTDSKLRSVYTFPDTSTNTGGTQVDVYFYPSFFDEAKNLTVQNELSGALRTGTLEHRLLVGVEYTNLETGFSGEEPLLYQLDLFDEDFISDPQPSFFGPSVPTVTETRSVGVYVQDLIALTPQFKLLAGLRHDSFDLERREEGVKTGEADGNELSPRAGLVWQPTPAQALYVGWSRSFTIVRGMSSSARPFDPEEGEQFELGFKQELLDGRLGLGMAVYELTRDKVRTPDTSTPDPRDQIQSGERRSRGFELDLSGSPRPDLRITASYGYTDAEVTRDNRLRERDELADVPRHSSSLWTSWTLPPQWLPGLNAGAGVFYQSEREARLPNVAFTLDEWVRVDAALGYTRGAWGAQLNVINLFDEEYLTGGEQAVFGETVFPNAPTSLFLTLSYRL